MEQQPSGGNKKLTAIVGLVVIVAVIGITALALTPKKSNDSASGNPTPSAATLGASTVPTASASSYKDGSFSGQGSYDSPGGTETVSVSLTLKGGVVTDSTVSTTGHNPTGKTYQDMFISGYKGQVTGKNINDINLSKVSGSSLTSQGFNEAVSQIKSEAKA